MARIFDSAKQMVEITCPECEHKHDVEIEVGFYEPSIEVDIEAIQ